MWGQDTAMAPAMSSVEDLNHLLGLVMRHFNSILSGFEAQPPVVAPFWEMRVTAAGKFEDAEAWAYGFGEGVKLNRSAWQALLQDPQGRRWYRPIGLLGEDGFSADQDELTETPAQRQALAAEIEDSLIRIHAFWLPLRQALQECHVAQRLSSKVRRNEPCPCGSGKKFKKCCGAPAELQ
ncbi:UPF0149 family protein [Roseateles oligotrophus]